MCSCSLGFVLFWWHYTRNGQGLLLPGLGGPYEVLEIKSGSAVCKTSALNEVLSLQLLLQLFELFPRPHSPANLLVSSELCSSQPAVAIPHLCHCSQASAYSTSFFSADDFILFHGRLGGGRQTI